MENNQNVAEVLNDLIQINNDRINGYERAIKELKEGDADLKDLFMGYIDQSRNVRNALGTEVQALGVKMDEGTTASGKIYRAWMDVKALFTGNDRQTVLNNCEFGEDAAQKAYNAALDHPSEIAGDLRLTIENQKKSLRESHDRIKHLRDANPAS